MKHPSFIPAASAAALCLLQACEAFIPERPDGRLSLRFSEDVFLSTRAAYDIPDTNDFILTILDPKGVELYKGKYGESPEALSVPSGSYTVFAVSEEFSVPKFSAPQYGDRQVVVVSSGRDTCVELICRQMNAGVKLNIAQNFLTSYPGGSLLLRSDDGKLLYSYSEKRIAYFNPGNVSLVLSDGGKDEVLLTRAVESQEILVLNVSAPQPGSAPTGQGIRVSVDTTRVWTVEDYVIGQEDGRGGDKVSAYNVGQARAAAGAEDVWVCGYIVGGDLSSSSASFTPPFKSRTNLVLASRSSVTDKASCLSIQLQKGDIRDALNLVDNPDILGTEIFLKGDIVEAYYGIPGLQNITEYAFKE